MTNIKILFKMPEFNILDAAGLPQIKKREGMTRVITPEIKEKAEKLGFDFYDGDRKYGYGGYYYDGRWKAVAKIIKERYNLNSSSKVLIDRCHKGFLVFDLKELIPGITVYGIHPGEYALIHAMEGYGKWALINGKEEGDLDFIEEKAKQEIMPYLLKAESTEMPFKDNFFDVVISIENACSYPCEECKKVIKEIIRISKDNGKKCYIQNDSWRDENEKQKLLGWTYLCKTFLDVNDWEKLYQEAGYNGDWGYTIIT